MGYKLAGYEVIGGVEIDPRMMQVYRTNFQPKFSYLMGVQEFKKIFITDLPEELFNLDILDGSPPCSSFSTASVKRENFWGKEKKFREGQAEQNLDDLFFEFIDIAEYLQPRVVIAENVKGLVQGKARGYVKLIAKRFDKIGYDLQLFLLNAAFMGVPQKRERTFFIAKRRDQKFGQLKMDFKESPILFRDIKEKNMPETLSPRIRKLWEKRLIQDLHIGFIQERIEGKITGFNTKIQRDDQPCYTITACNGNILFSEPRHMTDLETMRAQTFPEDYDFGKMSPTYICGMSVPPFMMQRVANEVYQQWFKSKRYILRKTTEKQS